MRISKYWLDLRIIFALTLVTLITGFILLKFFSEASILAKGVSLVLLPGFLVAAKYFSHESVYLFYFIVIAVQILYCYLILKLHRKLTAG